MKHRILVLLITAILVLPVVGSAEETMSQGTVNLNTASAEQLQLLPRVGPSLAAQIISFRESNGPFKSVDELVSVKGIGEKSLRNMSPYLSVKGDTTLSEKVRLPRTSKPDSKES